MIELREMQFLVSLAQHRHFAKAAEACGISQPAFSMRIRALEDRLGVAIVRRGNRFLGFTERGDMLVERARGILEDAISLEQEVNAKRGEVSGTLALGVVPTALAFASRLCVRMRDAHPDILSRIESSTSLSIQQRIEEGTIDAGITYQDGASTDLLNVTHLYDEKYVLVVPVGMVPKSAVSISWYEAAELPLSLLEPQMQNRRILDKMFDEVGVRPNVVAETNVFTPSVIMAQEGVAATIIPEVLISSLGNLGATQVLPLTEPELYKSICLVTPTRRLGLPTIQALRVLAGVNSE